MNKVFKALSDPTRRRVLQLLRERPMSAGELSDHFAVSKPTMSAHFAVLQEAGLIEAEKSGRTIIYRLVMSVLEEALLGFAGCAVVISHDRWFLDRVATHMLAFEGNSEVVWFEGNYQEYAADYHRRKGASVDQPHRIRYKKLVH